MTETKKPKNQQQILAIHHTTFLVADLDKSLEFYCGALGLEIDPARPGTMSFPGAWLTINGSQQIHLMQLPNPDSVKGRPKHGGRDRHAAYLVQDVDQFSEELTKQSVEFTRSASGRAAIFCRDPDGNALEFIQI